jgi:hypothetical protein
MNQAASMLTNVGTGAATGAAAGATAGGIGAVPGAIIGAGVPLVTTIISGILGNSSTDDTNKQNMAIYQDEKKTKLAAQRTQDKQFQQQFDANTATTAFNRQQTLYGNKVGKEQTAFNRQKSAYDSAVALLSNQQGLNQTKTAPFIKRA